MKAAVTSGSTPGNEDAKPTGWFERGRVTDCRRVMKTGGKTPEIIRREEKIFMRKGDVHPNKNLKS